MHTWYADDSAFHKSKGDKKQNIFLYGGILISDAEDFKLCSIIQGIKTKFLGSEEHNYLPIKWNFKDLNRHYESLSRQKQYQCLLPKSKDWREDIFLQTMDIQYKIFISVVENTEPDKRLTRKGRDELRSILFSNALMRIGMFVSHQRIRPVQLVLDWEENPDCFMEEYQWALRKGKNTRGQNYFCGNLHNLGFHQVPYFTKMANSDSLQFTDLVMGAIKDYTEAYLQGRTESVGTELTKAIISKFYGYPTNIIGYGLNIPTKWNRELRYQLTKLVNETLSKIQRE